MKAAILQQAGSPLEVRDVQPPRLHASSVRVRVLATHILPFTSLVVGGQLPFPLPTPYVPGLCAIGIVEETADDLIGIEPGQKVFCSPLISARTSSLAPERILKGWFGVTAKCEHLLQLWKDGAFAEQAVYPVECVTPIDALGAQDDAQLGCMYYLCIAYGAYLRGDFKPGQSVVINGATGNLGAAAALVALAMGASHIYAVGRNKTVLQTLAALDTKRITAVALPAREEDYSAEFAARIGETDLLIDAVGLMDSPALVQAGLSVLRPHGTGVFLGGVASNVPISYLTTLVKELNIKGSWMYPDRAPADIAAMIETGVLNLGAFQPQTYPLERVNDAIAAAGAARGLDYIILQP